MKFKLGILVMTLSLMLVGCSNPDTSDKPQDNKPNSNKVEENVKPESEVDDASEENDSSKEKEPQKEVENIDLKIYTADIDDTEKIVEFKTVTLKEDSTVEDKLKELCAYLEKEYFKDEKAKIVVESIDDKGIATINLVSQEDWHQHFQGSTGGLISQATIVETLLQRDYSGEWINGLNVLIDGELKEGFEHAPFLEVFKR